MINPGAEAGEGEEEGERAADDDEEGPEIPVFLWSAEFDVVGIEAPIGSMYAKLCAKYEDCPRFTQFQGHNHVSHIMSLNSADDEVGLAVMEFVDSVMAH